MRNPISCLLGTLLAWAMILTVPASSPAARGDCGQPTTNGATPAITDVLTILRSAVGQVTACDAKPCVCDVNGDGKITVQDVIILLRRVVNPALPAPNTCQCPIIDYYACTSARLHSLPGSTLDYGFTGIAHGSDLGHGSFVDVNILKRCSDSQETCLRDSECVSRHCVATCDCVTDPTCEFTGAAGAKQCVTTLNDCDTNADCPSGVACRSHVGPPLPLSSGGTPVCVQSWFESPLTGTANAANGEAVASATVKVRIHLGITISKPCPRCGAPDQAPKVGDAFTCDGGQFHGAACTVDAVSDLFGGTSFDCPSQVQSSVMGVGATLQLREITTGTTTKTAKLPCANFAFRGNPLNAPANPGKCLDNNTACSSNADCTRCSGNPAVACTNNADCNGKGTCAEAPDQPVTCGFWCGCGFCDNNPNLPCFDTSECPSGQACQAGTGAGTAQNTPQQKPNDCTGDKFLCGLQEDEQCANTFQGSCSEEPYRACQDGSSTCEDNNAGECIVENRRCFEPRLTRTGDPSPLGRYCANDGAPCSADADCRRCNDDSSLPCSTNGDCDGKGPCAASACVDRASAPETVALLCMPATSSGAINAVAGLTGPAAFHGRSFVELCSCGDSVIGCGEDCDDGNTAAGDGCNENCGHE
jgi:hypothetical protein